MVIQILPGALHVTQRITAANNLEMKGEIGINPLNLEISVHESLCMIEDIAIVTIMPGMPAGQP